MPKKKNKLPTTTVTQEVTLENLCLAHYTIGSQARPPYEISSYGDWDLTIYRAKLNDPKLQIHTLQDFVMKFCQDQLSDDFSPIESNENGENLSLMDRLNIYFVENDKAVEPPFKTFGGLPEQFTECVTIRSDGNSKCIVGKALGHVYYFSYGTS
ncbi:hypothetical protein C9374_000234 [Naegleria lovaniensis]|uniref:Uncharacterized protein n=1 Tax=Naegleria lovaniensis TaxID=51637 RepID=A0AA88KMB8_NAELO|nr:uncharacterized protein C9374_000234 [Naegleria lovaniensis]KAG2388795.1 hypothetical protein C9374_000234 [Naegleria lovaniensis]